MKIERILIVGLGSIGKRHASLLRQIAPDVVLIALRHRCPGDDMSIDIDHTVTSIESAIELHPQAAIIANPATFHLELALQLAAAGIHLMVEKPIASSPDGVADLIQLCKDRNLVLMTGYNLRFLPSLQKFREYITNGKIGRVLSVRAETGQWLPSWRPDSDYRQTVSAQSALGGGVLLELSHEIDYLRWVFGDVAWVSAIKRQQSDLEIDVEDTVHVVLGFEPDSDVVGVVANLNLDFVRRDSTRCCTAIGENGTLCWNAISGSVDIFEAGTNEWRNLCSGQDQIINSYSEELKHFLTCASENVSPLIKGYDGLKVLEIIDAINQSASSESVVYMDREGPA